MRNQFHQCKRARCRADKAKAAWGGSRMFLHGHGASGRDECPSIHQHGAAELYGESTRRADAISGPSDRPANAEPDTIVWSISDAIVHGQSQLPSCPAWLIASGRKDHRPFSLINDPDTQFSRLFQFRASAGTGNHQIRLSAD